MYLMHWQAWGTRMTSMGKWGQYVFNLNLIILNSNASTNFAYKYKASPIHFLQARKQQSAEILQVEALSKFTQTHFSSTSSLKPPSRSVYSYILKVLNTEALLHPTKPRTTLLAPKPLFPTSRRAVRSSSISQIPTEPPANFSGELFTKIV